MFGHFFRARRFEPALFEQGFYAFDRLFDVRFARLSVKVCQSQAFIILEKRFGLDQTIRHVLDEREKRAFSDSGFDLGKRESFSKRKLTMKILDELEHLGFQGHDELGIVRAIADEQDASARAFFEGAQAEAARQRIERHTS